MVRKKRSKRVCYLIPILGLIYLSFFLIPINAQVGEAQLSGFVIKVTELGEVFIDFGERSGIRSGMVLNVYKEGEEIVHPVTGRVLKGGHIFIGELEVRRVGLDYSIAVVSALDPGKSIETGDVVRLPGRIQVSTRSETSTSPAATTNFTTILIGEQRSFSERAKVVIETTYVGYREGVYIKDIGWTTAFFR